MDNIEKIAKDVGESGDKMNLLATQALLQFDTMAQLQKDERESMNKLHAQEMESTRKHYRNIIFALIATLFLLIAGIVGSVVYVLANYDFEFASTYQELDIGGDGNQNVYDGIHYNTD